MIKNGQSKEFNRNFHLTHWEDIYEEVQMDFVNYLHQCYRLLDGLQKLDETLKNIDSNRRENAVSLGVTIKESDSKYDTDALKRGIPSLLESIKKKYKEIGIGELTRSPEHDLIPKSDVDKLIDTLKQKFIKTDSSPVQGDNFELGLKSAWNRACGLVEHTITEYEEKYGGKND